MQTITTAEELAIAIQNVEVEQANKLVLLKSQLYSTYESLKPLNIIRNSIKEVTSAPDFKEDVLMTSLGLTTGYITKRLLVGASHNPITRIAGSLLQVGVTNLVSKNPNTIKLIGNKLLNLLGIHNDEVETEKKEI